jgi:hypothetical protein
MMPTRRIDHYLRQLLRARLSSDDFKEAGQYLTVIETAEDDVVRRGLLTAAIVAYYRPFTNSDEGSAGNATSRLSVNIEKLLNQDEQDMHAVLKALRNEVIAHTAYDRKPVERKEGLLSGVTMCGPEFDLLAEKLDLPLFQKMCRVLGGHCFSKILELNSKIVKDEHES